ncbi:MAG: hypothetical protein OXF20_11975 [Gammaproteobacteria bacterium]|nr:hypothetical protein [Gammaproteobacteria bacterium]
MNILVNEHGQIGLGEGALCSTHILKFERKDCPDLVLNEFFCMKLSSAAGLPASRYGIQAIWRSPVITGQAIRP